MKNTWAWIYGDEKTIRDYASGVINSAIPAFILGGFGGGVSSFKKKDKKDLYKHISPKKWKQQYFDIGAQIADANKDLENADQFNKKDFENRIAYDNSSYVDMFCKKDDGSWSTLLDTVDREGLADAVESLRGNDKLLTYADLGGNLLNKVRKH